MYPVNVDYKRMSIEKLQTIRDRVEVIHRSSDPGRDLRFALDQAQRELSNAKGRIVDPKAEIAYWEDVVADRTKKLQKAEELARETHDKMLARARKNLNYGSLIKDIVSDELGNQSLLCSKCPGSQIIPNYWPEHIETRHPELINWELRAKNQHKEKREKEERDARIEENYRQQLKKHARFLEKLGAPASLVEAAREGKQPEPSRVENNTVKFGH